MNILIDSCRLYKRKYKGLTTAKIKWIYFNYGYIIGKIREKIIIAIVILGFCFAFWGSK